MKKTTLLAVCAALLLAGCGGEGASQATPRVLAPLADTPPEIITLYNRSCISCHSSGAAGAPRTGDLAAWETRAEQGMDILLEHTISGYKGMPPMGMCMDCDAEQFVGLIEYMAGRRID